MDTHIIKIFINGLRCYFNTEAKQTLQVEAPYLEEARSTPTLDHSAVIGISGSYKGCLYVTAPVSLINALLKRIGENTDRSELRADMVGELCNTIAGNARSELGSSFMISTPFIFTGRPSEVFMPKNTDCIVIPMTWEGSRALLVVSLRKQEEIAA